MHQNINFSYLDCALIMYIIMLLFSVHAKETSLQGGSEKREGGMGGACYICPDNSDANKRNGPG